MMSSLPTSFHDKHTRTDYTHTHTHMISHTAGSPTVLSVFPVSGALQGVGTGLQTSSVVSSQVLSPQCSNGHLVEVAELEEELHRRGVAAHYCCVVSNTPVLPLGVCTDSNHMTGLNTPPGGAEQHFNGDDWFIIELRVSETMAGD